MNQKSQTDLRITGDHRLADEWELVLLAQGLSPSVRQTSDGVVVSVPEAEVGRALVSLSAYDWENPQKPLERVEPIGSGSWVSGIAVGLTLGLFYSITVQWLPALSWFARGAADAERILQGELWRTVTALTLHADVAHVLSNAIAVGLFLSAVNSMLGAGIGGALVLLAGAGGNLVNAMLHGSPHVSVGASTAVFGAVGLLGSLGLSRRRRNALSGWRAWLPVAAALALLGMLGSSGQRVDIWAHLFGLLAGAVIGLPLGLVKPRATELRLQWTCGMVSLALLVYCWILAFR
ncbi:MAG TPA: rhomboid family intramembrane serine protease [Candidatus Limnocylindria bacterium]|nr:rhomboid family intramembrane serine protease [Candidatus Limnocylindria bacterium]